MATPFIVHTPIKTTLARSVFATERLKTYP